MLGAVYCKISLVWHLATVEIFLSDHFLPLGHLLQKGLSGRCIFFPLPVELGDVPANLHDNAGDQLADGFQQDILHESLRVRLWRSFVEQFSRQLGIERLRSIPVNTVKPPPFMRRVPLKHSPMGAGKCKSEKKNR